MQCAGNMELRFRCLRLNEFAGNDRNPVDVATYDVYNLLTHQDKLAAPLMVTPKVMGVEPSGRKGVMIHMQDLIFLWVRKAKEKTICFREFQIQMPHEVTHGEIPTLRNPQL